MKKHYLFLAAACSMFLAVNGRSKASEPVRGSINADLVSSYLWRGQRLDGAAIQPNLSLEWGGLSISSWGSSGFSGNNLELDLNISYAIGGFSLGLTDYWCANSNTSYFNFGDATPHVLEASLGYDFDFLALSWNTNVLGAMGTTAEGRDAYSSYFEISAPFSLGGLEWSIAAGATPWCNDYYGADGFAVVNCSLTASKELSIADKTMPVFATLMANPNSKQMFFCIGISF